MDILMDGHIDGQINRWIDWIGKIKDKQLDKQVNCSGIKITFYKNRHVDRQID